MGQLFSGNEVIRCQEQFGAGLQMAVDRFSHPRDLESALGVVCGFISIDLYPEDEWGDILCCQTTIHGTVLVNCMHDNAAVQDFAAMVCSFVERLLKPALSEYAFDGHEVNFISHGILIDSDDTGANNAQLEPMPVRRPFQGW